MAIDNLPLLKVILDHAADGSSWCGVAVQYGPWQTVRTRMVRWATAGVRDLVVGELRLQRAGIVIVSTDGTSIQVHPGGTAT